MNTQALLIPGGIGLFLLGTILLTDGLRGLSGDALRQFLARSTVTPLRGVFAGATATAIIQSSSATTVMAVGFVGAGLITFPQALGIIFGANIGTTVTAWLVAIIGFKLQLGTLVLPLVLIGVLLKVFGRGRAQHFGWALSGFSLLFVGITAIQSGMAPFEGLVTPDDFPGDTFAGRLQLVLIGMTITAVTQSSSAGIATALVALSTGAISFPQSAAMVIGMNVGTSFTAALATVGGSTAARQTGYAHVVYNVLAGVMAFLLLEPLSALVGVWASQGGGGNAQIALAAFHTFFNVMGVVLALPLVVPFAGLIKRLVPERGPRLLRRLDEAVLQEPGSAVDATAATVRDIFSVLMKTLAARFSSTQRTFAQSSALATVEEALLATRSYVDQIRTDPAQAYVHLQHVAAVHVLDHLFRLTNRCRQEERIKVITLEPKLSRLSLLLAREISALPTSENLDTAVRRFDRLRVIMHVQRNRYREHTVELASQQAGSAATTLEKLDAMRWLQRVTYHVWRIALHLRELDEYANASGSDTNVSSDQTPEHTRYSESDAMIG